MYLHLSVKFVALALTVFVIWFGVRFIDDSKTMSSHADHLAQLVESVREMLGPEGYGHLDPADVAAHSSVPAGLRGEGYIVNPWKGEVLVAGSQDDSRYFVIVDNGIPARLCERYLASVSRHFLEASISGQQVFSSSSNSLDITAVQKACSSRDVHSIRLVSN